MKLHFQTFGAGPPLLILHGLLGSLDNWVPPAQSLAQHFQVFLLDQRNHGRSPHAAEFNYDAMAEDLGEFLADQKLAVAHVLGHSMGGKTAMRFAQLHPAAVRKLVVVDMAPRAYAPRYHGILDAMHALDLSTLQQRNEVGAALEAAAPDINIRQFLLKNLGRHANGGLVWKPNLAAIRANYSHLRAALPLAPAFAGPALFVRGGRSDYLSAPDWDLIQQGFPGATLHTIPQAGHWLHAEAPEEFLRVVSEFLRNG